MGYREINKELKSIRQWSWTVSPLANEKRLISEELSSKHREESQSSLSAHFQAPLSQLERPMWVCSKPIKVRKCFLSSRLQTLTDWGMSHCSLAAVYTSSFSLSSSSSVAHYTEELQSLPDRCSASAGHVSTGNELLMFKHVTERNKYRGLLSHL